MFKVIMDRNIEYNKWVRFRHAKVEDFEIYYTDLPEATSNQLSIKNISKKICRIDVIDDNASIYIRAVSPSAIEYVVSTEDDIKNNNYMSNINTVEFN